MVKKNHPLKRIDFRLADEIAKFAKNNDMSFRKASQEVAQIVKIKLSNKKIYKEIII